MIRPEKTDNLENAHSIAAFYVRQYLQHVFSSKGPKGHTIDTHMPRR